MKRNAPENGKTVDVPKMYFAGEEEKCSKEEEEENGACEIGIIHYMLVYPRQGV